MPDDLEAKVDQILAQVTETNGRVNDLEDDMGDVKDVLYGDDERQTPGLVAESHETRAMLRQWHLLTMAFRWAAGALGTATVIGAVNLVTGA